MRKSSKWFNAALLCGAVGCVSGPEPAPTAGAPEARPVALEGVLELLRADVPVKAGTRQKKSA